MQQLPFLQTLLRFENLEDLILYAPMGVPVGGIDSDDSQHLVDRGSTDPE